MSHHVHPVGDSVTVVIGHVLAVTVENITTGFDAHSGALHSVDIKAVARDDHTGLSRTTTQGITKGHVVSGFQSHILSGDDVGFHNQVIDDVDADISRCGNAVYIHSTLK